MEPTLIATITLGALGLLITFIFNFHARRIEHDRMNKELFTEFNKRYDNLNEILEEIVSTCNSLDDLKKHQSCDDLRYKLNDYFNLCAEEYYWHTKKRIDKRIWNSWKYGMNSWYKKYPVIQEAWKDELKTYGYSSFYLKKGDHFFEE